MTNCFYDPGVCRQFNMLGAYIGYYETLPEKTESDYTPSPSPRPLPPDCLGHIKEPTKGCDSTDSEPSPSAECDFDDIEEGDADEQDDQDYILDDRINQEEVARKMQDAELTIMTLKEEFDRMNKDHFELEQMMKTQYYEDRRRSKEEYSLLQQQLDRKQKQLMELSQMKEQSEQFWEDRKKELNDLMNDVILNVRDMCQYQELCNVFKETDE